ncbi:PLP-dependent transferase [Dentipellis sp. KUC8613]|nr:PLP-dependent transferase [Dentipellis sp. KUC8613]
MAVVWQSGGSTVLITAKQKFCEFVRQSLYKLELVLSQQTAPKDTAAIVIEPVIGEGRYGPAPHAFPRGLREICDKHGILLVVDGAQNGFGHTGKNFAIKYSGVRPGTVTVAKSLANGSPLSAIISCKELMNKLKPGSIGQDESLLGPHILDVRGLRPMVGVTFASPSHSAYDVDATDDAGLPRGFAGRVAKRCLAKGMLILTTSVYDSETIRFIPPLNISHAVLAKGVAIFTLQAHIECIAAASR